MAKKTKGKGKESNVANISGKARTKRSDSTPNYLLWTCAIGETPASCLLSDAPDSTLDHVQWNLSMWSLA